MVQYLETLHPTERQYQVFALEEDTREENVPEMSHLHVVPILVNGVAEEEALLDSGSQIDNTGCQRANSKLELSQLLFISVRERKLIKSPRCIGLSTYTDST